MSEIDSYRKSIEQDCAISIHCECGFITRYENPDRFNSAINIGEINFSADGDLEWAFATDNFKITCPKCGGKGSRSTLQGGDTDTIKIQTESPEDQDSIISSTDSISDRRFEFSQTLSSEKDTKIKINCSCLTETTYESQEDFEANQDSINPYELSENEVAVQCPECSKTAESKAHLYEKEDTRLIELVPKEGEENEQVGCPECDNLIKEEGFKQGPEYPSIGWEYYECPFCSSAYRVEKIEE